MGRMKLKDESDVTGEYPTGTPPPEVEKEAGAETSQPAPNGETGEPVKRKRKYTKRGTSPSGKLPLGAVPVEAQQAIATAPLMLYAAACNKFVGVRVEFDAATVNAATLAFGAWLASIDVELSPGLAYLALSGMAIVSTIPSVVSGIQAKRALSGKTPDVGENAAPPGSGEKASDAAASAGSGQPASA